MQFDIRCLSLLEYCKTSDSADLAKAKEIIKDLKYGRMECFIPHLVRFLESHDAALMDIIPADCILVPIPKSKPLVKDGLLPSMEICNELHRRGRIGKGVFPILTREMEVRKAAFQQGADARPSVDEHFESISCIRLPVSDESFSKIVLVDDIVTQGRTACACYKRIREIYPGKEITFFSAARTMWEFKNLYNPNESLIIMHDSGKTFVDHTPNKNPLMG